MTDTLTALDAKVLEPEQLDEGPLMGSSRAIVFVTSGTRGVGAAISRSVAAGSAPGTS